MVLLKIALGNEKNTLPTLGTMFFFSHSVFEIRGKVPFLYNVT